MRTLAAIFLLVMSAHAARAADAPADLLPADNADGWVRAFDGGDLSGLVIEGDAKVTDGVLVIGGAKPARLSLNRDLGDDFEIRIIYRTEPPGQLMFRANWSRMGGSSSMGTTVPEPPAAQGAAPEWRELRCACHKGAPRRPYDIRLESWRDGKVAASPGPIYGGSDGDAPEVWFEVPAGTTLFVRGVAVHPDPTAGSFWRSPWAFGVILLVVLVVLAAGVLLLVWRMSRRAAVAVAPPSDETNPSSGAPSVP